MALRDQDVAAAALAVGALCAGVLADESLDDPSQDLVHLASWLRLAAALGRLRVRSSASPYVADAASSSAGSG
jgi:hypothetical protein